MGNVGRIKPLTKMACPSCRRILEDFSIDEAATSGRSGENDDTAQFAARRLSVHNPYDEDWNDIADEDEGDDDEGDASSSAAGGGSPRVTQI